jgi:hypothetical protein
VLNAESTERVMMGMHLEKLVRRGHVSALDAGRFAATGRAAPA